MTPAKLKQKARLAADEATTWHNFSVAQACMGNMQTAKQYAQRSDDAAAVAADFTAQLFDRGVTA